MRVEAGSKDMQLDVEKETKWTLNYKLKYFVAKLF